MRGWYVKCFGWNKDALHISVLNFEGQYLKYFGWGLPLLLTLKNYRVAQSSFTCRLVILLRRLQLKELSGLTNLMRWPCQKSKLSFVVAYYFTVDLMWFWLKYLQFAIFSYFVILCDISLYWIFVLVHEKLRLIFKYMFFFFLGDAAGGGGRVLLVSQIMENARLKWNLEGGMARDQVIKSPLEEIKSC